MAKGGISKRKQTRNFLKSGQLESQISARQKRKTFQQKIKGRDARRNKGVLPAHQREKDEDAESEEEFEEVKRKKREAEEDESEGDEEEMDVDGLLGAEGMEGAEEGEGDEDEASDFEDDDLSGLGSDDEEGSDVDPTQHMEDLKALAEKDPEFFKYLQENDAELLNFDENTTAAIEDDDEDEDDEDMSDEEETEGKGKGKEGKKEKKKAQKKKEQVLTKELLKSWQKNILETRSFKSLRRLLIAFRSAAQSGTEAELDPDRERYEIQSPAVFNKLVVTTLKYTPMVFSAQIPYKEVSGKYKLASNSKAYATAQRLIKSYFVSLQSLLATTSSEGGIPSLAVGESGKLVPWIVGNRKVARAWTKMLLGLYDSAADETRVAAFLALRKLAVAADHSLRETVIKGTYATLLTSSRQTSMYTLPSITLMKNSASELFLLPGKQEGEQSYQLAFGYIRMLAILLRKGVKEGSKDAFKSVYNWQFVHAVDFWSIVLSASCDKERFAERGHESPLQQLLYPLIQVALGAIRLVPTSRYYPLRFHLVRSLLRIVQRTSTFIPLSTPLFEILNSPELSKRSKPSTLKPLDWEYYLKCPTSYQRTRVYADALAEETIHLLTEFFGSALSKSIAFPELALPAIVTLKRLSKKTLQNKGQVKLSSMVKVLIEKLESNSKWIEGKREQVEFGPMKRDKVERFLKDEDEARTPMGTHLKLMRRAREARKATLERGAAAGEDL
ncbi:mRNA-binding ribosome synthesis protein NOC2 [Sporobolomyces salmoneus]|uniref:mRNA-binding ribosome synthesis protein NOC2 n=1 Tax=Sporobolomyces salmoneus TaxID=183962 RepID=UPI00317BCD61